MNANRNPRTCGACAAAAVAACLLFGLLPAVAAGKGTAHRSESLAQSLVDATLVLHRETGEIGIAAATSNGCKVVASTDRTDVGEACEKSDLQPMHTGQAYIENENGAWSVSLPLHTAAGMQVGSVTIELKPAPGLTGPRATEQARKIAAEIELRIHSKKQLLGPAR